MRNFKSQDINVKAVLGPLEEILINLKKKNGLIVVNFSMLDHVLYP